MYCFFCTARRNRGRVCRQSIKKVGLGACARGMAFYPRQPAALPPHHSSVHRSKKQVYKISCTPQAYKAILNTCFEARARGRGERLPPEKKPCKSAFAFERNLAAARRVCWVSSVRRGPIEDGDGPVSAVASLPCLDPSLPYSRTVPEPKPALPAKSKPYPCTPPKPAPRLFKAQGAGFKFF